MSENTTLPQSGTHSRLAFALVLHHIHSVVFLKPTLSIRPSVPPSGSHKCLWFGGLRLTLRTVNNFIYFNVFIYLLSVQQRPLSTKNQGVPIQWTRERNIPACPVTRDNRPFVSRTRQPASLSTWNPTPTPCSWITIGLTIGLIVVVTSATTTFVTLHTRKSEIWQKIRGSSGRRLGSHWGWGLGEFVFEFWSKNAGFYAFYCEKTVLVGGQKPKPGGLIGLIDSIGVWAKFF